MPQFKHINVVYYYVSDLDEAREFYAHTVGFGEPVRETGQWVEFAVGDGPHFALHRTAPEHLDGLKPSRGPMRFSIAVSDLEAVYEELNARGVPFSRSPEYAPGFKLAEFIDPEGNPVRLVEHPESYEEKS